MPGSPAIRQRDCPLCGTRESSLLLERAPWRLVRCGGCELAYLPEVPTDAALDTAFEWSQSFARERYARWARSPLARLWTATSGLLRPPREVRALRHIRAALPPPARLLDIGCGDGRLLLAAQNAGYDTAGVELSPRMAARAAARVGAERIRIGRLEDAAFSPGGFDLIVSVSYLEHEPEPARVLRRAFELLRPGGACLHKVPNFDSRLRTFLGTRWSGYRWPEHVQYYTPRTLSRLMSAAGFVVAGGTANPWSDNFWLSARKPAAGTAT